MKELAFSALSSPYVTPLGAKALSVRPSEWKHAETANFIYHYFQGFVADRVSTEAEFYYHVIAHDLEKDTTRWERKAHIFIFERPEDWQAFQTQGKLERWTGGIHANNELFIQRDPSYKFQNWTLGHETAHLVLRRFYSGEIPLWLNEGYADYIGRVAQATFYRTRGYNSHPVTGNLTAASYIPLDQLSNLLTYPEDIVKVQAFYAESEKLVRFLSAADKSKFLQLLDSLSKGSLFENALHNAYGSRFPSPHALEREFQPVATQPVQSAGASSPAAGGAMAAALVSSR